jgi:hypothetical protein
MWKPTFMNLGVIVAALVSVAFLTPPAQADDAPFGGVTSSWHEQRQGFSWVTGAGALQGGTVHKLPPESQSLAACPRFDHFCRGFIHARYDQARADWRTFNGELWSVASSLPTCVPADGAAIDCARESALRGETMVVLGGGIYYAQDSLRPVG